MRDSLECPQGGIHDWINDELFESGAVMLITNDNPENKLAGEMRQFCRKCKSIRFIMKELLKFVNVKLIPEGYKHKDGEQFAFGLVKKLHLNEPTIVDTDEIARCLVCGHFMQSYVRAKHQCFQMEIAL